jgi:hypothetical protein
MLVCRRFEVSAGYLEADDLSSKAMRWATCSQQYSTGHSYRPLLMAGGVCSGESRLDVDGPEMV